MSDHALYPLSPAPRLESEAAPSHEGFWRCEECGAANDAPPGDMSRGLWRFTGRIWQHYCPGRHPQAGPADARRSIAGGAR